jgi:hypothetical protein
VWFLGLLRSLVGKADAALAQLGRLGWQAVIGVGVLAPAAYIASYYRYFIRIPETIDTTLRNRAPRTVLPIAWMDQLVLHSPFEQATYRFTIKTLLRSERHSLLFGAFAGLGLVLAFETLASAFSAASAPGDPPNVELLSAPFVLAYFVICGLRFVFDIPAELRANWVHQAILHHEQREPAALAGKVILTFILPWVVVCLPLYVRAWGWSIGAGHVAVLTAACSLLAKLLLRRFHKIPFTCTYPTWKQSATVMILLYVLGFWGFAFLLPGLERSLIMRTPLFLWILSALLLLAGVVLRRFLAVEVVDTSLIFEEKSPSPFEILNLSGR